MKTLNKVLLIFSMLAVTAPALQAGDDADEVLAVRTVIDNIFDAMRAGDSETLSGFILPDAPLDRISPDKPVERGTLSGWTDWVGTLKPGQADEQVFDVVINVEGPLATAWAPFTIAIDGVLKSCGINHFIFVKTPEGWKVAYLIDTHTPEKCLKG